MIQRAYGIAVGMLYERKAPERNPRYLRFIRTFPCVGCGARRWIEAAHTGAHGIGQKASDLDALPMCHACHRTGPAAYHKIGPVRFQQARGIDFTELRVFFQNLWKQGYRNT
jgi:hypothetical protein